VRQRGPRWDFDSAHAPAPSSTTTRIIHALVDESAHSGGYFKDYDFVRASVGVTFGMPRF
jgi:hypothetical protein